MVTVRRADPGREVRPRRWLRGGVLISGLAILFGSSPAIADEGKLIYALSAEGRGMAIVYNRKNLLPVSPLVGLGVPGVVLQLDDSPAATARATALEPGVFGAANGLSQIFGAPPGLVPAYPLYADAKYPVGPPTASLGTSSPAPVPGTGPVEVASASAAAEPDSASGQARLGGLGGAGSTPASGFGIAVPSASEPAVRDLFHKVASILAQSGHTTVATAEPDGTMVAMDNGSVAAWAGRSGTVLRAEVRSTMGGVELLGGLVRVGRMRTTAALEWPSPSVPAKPSFTTSLADISILGVPALIDSGGIHLQQGAAPAPAADQVTRAFAEHGVSFGPGVTTTDKETAQGSALRFAFEGEVQPGETDTFVVDFGRAALSFYAAMGEGSPPSQEASAPASTSAHGAVWRVSCPQPLDGWPGLEDTAVRCKRSRGLGNPRLAEGGEIDAISVPAPGGFRPGAHGDGRPPRRLRRPRI